MGEKKTLDTFVLVSLVLVTLVLVTLVLRQQFPPVKQGLGKGESIKLLLVLN